MYVTLIIGPTQIILEGQVIFFKVHIAPASNVSLRARLLGTSWIYNGILWLNIHHRPTVYLKK